MFHIIAYGIIIVINHWPPAIVLRLVPLNQKLTWIVNSRNPINTEHAARKPHFRRIYNWRMDPFRVVKQAWSPGDTREVETSRIDRQIGVEYDSYRRIYLADGHEWIVAGKIARDDGKTYYILECVL